MLKAECVMKRRSDKEQKRVIDDARLLRSWKKFHREEREAVLAGPHGSVLAELFRMLDHLECIQPSQLIGLARAIDWMAIPYDVKLTVLHWVNNSITKYRDKRGLEPIDDNLPGQPDTPFRTIKAIIFAASPPARASTGTQPGSNIQQQETEDVLS
jgi:hypothetical protein